MTKAFTKDHIGCWIDGAYGEDHRRAKLSAMLSDCEACCQIGDEITRARIRSLITDLEGDAPDDYGDDIEAVEELASFTADGLVWLEEAGDLILTTEEQAS